MKADYRIVSLTGITCMIAGISTLVFFLVPNALSLFSFSGMKLFQGEFWRLLTFPFAHVSLSHLLQNIIALIVALFLMFEIRVLRHHYLLSFCGASLLVALIDVLAFPALLIAGASVGAYALFGAVSARGSDFVPRKVMIPLLAAPLLLQSFLFSSVSSETLPQVLFHSVGFVFGCALLLSLKYITTQRTRVLEVAYEMS